MDNLDKPGLDTQGPKIDAEIDIHEPKKKKINNFKLLLLKLN